MTAPAAALDRPGEARVYPVPDQETGEVVEHPSITDIIGVLDPKHICDWKQKVAMLGAAMREDLQVKIAAANLLPAGKPRNSELRKLLAEAIVAGQIIEKGHPPADAGTGKHSLTERLDELVPPGSIKTVDELGLPRPLHEIACAYVDAMAAVEILHTEVTVVSITHGYAGTGDRIIRFRPLDQWTELFDQYDLGRGCFVFDNKFGAVHDTVALQLAAIANAEHIWDSEAGTLSPLPDDLRRDVGFVFNPDKGLLPVDLTGAHEAFLGARAAHRWIGRKPVLPAIKVRGGDVGATAATEVTATPASSDDAERLNCEACNLGMHVCGMCRTPIGHGAETCEKCIPGDGAPIAEPTYISAPLAVITADLAPTQTDPFAGLPDNDGKPQIDRAAKREWLVGRLEALKAIPGGLDAVVARWPVVDGVAVPTFKQSTDHTVEQLELIAQAITDAEAEVRAPLRDDDPTDPRIIPVANDDARVLALIERLTNLPPDLLAAVEAQTRKERVPSLSRGRLTEAHLLVVEPLVAAAETEYAPRAKVIGEHLQIAAEHGVSEAAICATLGVPSARHIFDVNLGHLANLADTIALGVIVERDGALVVDNPAQILTAYGDSRAEVWKAGRKAAGAAGIESPKDSDAVLAHPLLTAALAVV